MGRGRVITFMLLCTHRHSKLIIFLAVQLTQASSSSIVIINRRRRRRHHHHHHHRRRRRRRRRRHHLHRRHRHRHHHHHHHHHRHHRHHHFIRTPASACTTELVSHVHSRVGFRVHNRGPDRPDQSTCTCLHLPESSPLVSLVPNSNQWEMCK